MGALHRRTYVISDSHLGGAYAEPGSGDRGFRMCTHARELAQFIDAVAAKPVDNPPIEVVIDGDLVDFLAERDPAGQWAAFTYDQDVASKKLEAIVARDRIVFDALARFIGRGHRLVILLGNHDVELALPEVRRTLARALDVQRGADYELIRQDEAYVIGDTLIEHGNRYDPWNIVDHENLQRLCSLASRALRSQPQLFEPAPGSLLVAHMMNPVKQHYKFVDLLKPETAAVVPLLLTLEPGFRNVLGKIALIASKAHHAIRLRASAAQPLMVGALGMDRRSDVSLTTDMMAADLGDSSSAGGPTTDEHRALHSLLNDALGDDAHHVHAVARESTGSGKSGAHISAFAGFVDRTLGMAELLLSHGHKGYQGRLDALLVALRSLQNDHTFDEAVETDPVYLEAATALTSNASGIRHVVFGHTHMAKNVALSSGGQYLNSGTWADVMQFPRDVVTGSRDAALPRLREFVQSLLSGTFSSFALFRPTYVRLDLDTDGRVTPALYRYENATEV